MSDLHQQHGFNVDTARAIYQSSRHDLGCVLVDSTPNALEHTGIFKTESEGASSSWSYALVAPVVKLKESLFDFIAEAPHSNKDEMVVSAVAGPLDKLKRSAANKKEKRRVLHVDMSRGAVKKASKRCITVIYIYI